MMCLECGDLFPIGKKKWSGADKHRTDIASGQLTKGRFDISLTVDLEQNEFLTDSLRRSLHIHSLPHGFSRGRARQHGNRCGLGQKLPKQLQPFRAQHACEKAYASNVATGSIQAGHQAVLDRIAAGREDDWHRPRCRLSGDSSKGVPDYHAHWPAKEIAHQRLQPISLIVRIAFFDCDVLALDEACFRQSLAEYGHESHRVSQGSAAEKADHRHLWLLTPCRNRPRRSRAAEQRDELAASDHSITSSARASSVGGMSRPSVLAVFRLITSSRLLGCCTGKLVGFSPFRIRPVYTPASR